MDLKTSETNAKWQRANLAVMVLAFAALIGFLLLLVLIGVFHLAVPLWAFLFLVPLIVIVGVLRMRSRWLALQTAEDHYAAQSIQLTDNTFNAAQADFRRNKGEF